MKDVCHHVCLKIVVYGMISDFPLKRGGWLLPELAGTQTFKEKKGKEKRSRISSVKDIPEVVVDPPHFHGTFSPHSTGNTILPILAHQSSLYSLQIWFCEGPCKITDDGSRFWLTALPGTLPFVNPPCTSTPMSPTLSLSSSTCMNGSHSEAPLLSPDFSFIPMAFSCIPAQVKCNQHL